MVHQHHDAAYHEDWLGITYSLCTSGNAIVAIVAGVFAGVVRDRFGPVAPFDASLILLVISGVLVLTSWSENYGDATIDLKNTLNNAWVRIKEDRKIALLGVIQSFFEGSMYIFVFMWTPALESTSDHGIYHGWIFASFMICVLIGSNLFKYFLDKKLRVEKTSVYLFGVSAIALLLPTFIMNHTLRLAAFFVFEVCVGLFWPSMGFLRSRYVPEEVRATVMNLFRIPLNIIVVVVLANIGKLSEQGVFIACVSCLLPALLCQMHLVTLTVDSPEQVKREPEDRKGLTEGDLDGDVDVDVEDIDQDGGNTSTIGFPSIKPDSNKGTGNYSQVSTSDQTH
jgi:MFS family permease